MAKQYPLLRVVFVVCLSVILYAATRTQTVNERNGRSKDINKNATHDPALLKETELNIRSNNPNTSTIRVNWRALHLEEKQKTIIELSQVLKTNPLQSHFVSLQQDDEVLNFKELEERFRPLLQNRGIVFLGDSTARVLFGTIWCLIEGVFRNSSISATKMEGNMKWEECEQRQVDLKKSCEEQLKPEQVDNVTTKVHLCEFKASFSEESTPMHLQFAQNYVLGDIGEFDGFITNNRDRFIFYMMPCLHSLWSPGRREYAVVGTSVDWELRFQNFYSSLEKANPSNSFLFGTSVALCDSKLGKEKELIDLYLEDKEFVEGTPAGPFFAYNLGKTLLPPNYTGPIPVVKAEGRNHKLDNSLFDEAGSLKCMSVGLQVLSRHSLLNHSWMKVLDMYGATKSGFQDTKDGRHYIRGITLQRQLTLLLKAMENESVITLQSK